MDVADPVSQTYMDEFLELSSHISLNQDAADSYVWIPTGERLFLVNSCYQLFLAEASVGPMIEDNVVKVLSYLLKIEALAKLLYFGWRVVEDLRKKKCQTWTRLWKRKRLSRKGWGESEGTTGELKTQAFLENCDETIGGGGIGTIMQVGDNNLGGFDSQIKKVCKSKKKKVVVDLHKFGEVSSIERKRKRALNEGLF